MNIQQRAVGDVIVLSINGDITMSGNGSIRVTDKVRSAIQEGHSHVLLDLSHVRYVDSVGLGDLVKALAAVRNRGGALKLLNVTGRLNDLLVLTKLLSVFDCFDRESDALASFEPLAAPP